MRTHKSLVVPLRVLVYVSSYICVLILLYVFSYCYVCPAGLAIYDCMQSIHTLYVLILLNICVLVLLNICVLILLYVCPAGLAIYDCMQSIQAPVHTVCVGRAFSMASIFFLMDCMQKK